MRRVLLLLVIALAVLATTAIPAGADKDSGHPAGYTDPFDLVYSAEFDEGRIINTAITELNPEDSWFERPGRKATRGEPSEGNTDPIGPLLAELLKEADDDDRAILLVNYRDELDIPTFPIPALGEDRDSATNQQRLEEAQRLVAEIEEARTPVYEERRALYEKLGGRVLETFWLIDAMVVDVPLKAVETIVPGEGVQYLQLNADVFTPPDANPDNDVQDGRSRISSDPYFNLGQNSGWIGLLDTGVRTSHTLFNGPTNLALASDVTGDGDATDQCNHGTASGAIISANGNLGFAYRGATGIWLDSWDIYGDNCLVSSAHAVAGFEIAVAFLDRVIVGEIQIDASELSAVSAAADAAFDAGAVVVSANGNFGAEGPGSVRAPGNAHKSIGVGAIDVENGLLQGYSGLGPTADGRIKPDLTAPTNTETARSTSDVALSAFGGTSGATPYASAAAALLRNWMLGGVGVIDPGHVYSHLILAGQQPFPFDNSTGAGELVLPTGGYGFWGKTGVEHVEVIEIPIVVPGGRTKFEAAIWWPEDVDLHNDIDLKIIDPSGVVRDSSLTYDGVFEKVKYEAPYLMPGTWKVQLRGHSVTGSQTTYWSARYR